MPTWLSDLLGLAPRAELVAIIVVIVAIIKVFPFIRRFVRFIDAMIGDDRTPGIFERMDTQETSLASIQHEVTLNHGGSLKDSAFRSEQLLEKVFEILDNDDQRLKNIENTFTKNQEDS